MRSAGANLGRHLGFLACIYGLISIQVKSVSGEYGDFLGMWKVEYGVDSKDLRVGSQSTKELNVTIYDVDLTLSTMNFYFEIFAENTNIASVNKKVQRSEFVANNGNKARWQGLVAVRGHHFGYTQLYVSLHPATGKVERSQNTCEVVVLREPRLDNVYLYTSAALAFLMFIKLGTTLHLQRLKAQFIRPIGPIIGFCTRYTLLPLIGVVVGKLIFAGNKNLQIALFFTTLASSGSFSNVATVFLKGNINLSLGISTLNGLLQFVMLPVWILVLAPAIYSNDNWSIPFVDLLVGAVALLCALTLGLLLRHFIPLTTIFIFRYLKPLLLAVSVCLVGMTVGFNYFAFEQLTGLILAAALCVPLLGFVLSFAIAKILCRSVTDALTIAIESSVLNVLNPIVMLQWTLIEPQSDLVIIVPIMAGLISIVFMVVLYIVRRAFGWNRKLDDDAFDVKEFERLACEDY